MGASFNAPQILFLQTWADAERNYVAGLLPKLKAKGYTRLVEPCVGGFAMSSVAAETGWSRTAMHASDVWLYTSILGTTFAGRPLEELGIAVDGHPATFTGSAIEQAASALYLQLVMRMAAAPVDMPYFDAIRADLDLRRDAHIKAIAAHVGKLHERLKGLPYTPKDVWNVVDEVADDPNALVVCNPPTYKGAYEKFFDTDGRLTWNEPPYEVFDAGVHIYELMRRTAEAKCLVLCQQQQDPGAAARSPVYARHLSPGQNVYVCTNRPEEVTQVAGGLRVMPMKGTELAKLNLPIIRPDHDIGPQSKVSVMAVGAGEATYYRDLWMHKLDYRSAGYYVAVVIDGHVAGMIGYDAAPIYRPYAGAADDVRGALLLTFAVGAPHQHRLTRLTTMVALLSETLRNVLRPDLAVLVDRLITVELTKHPEAKGLRGLMKLQNRRADPKYGWRLIYGTERKSGSLSTIAGEWRKKEDQWQRSRAANREVEV